MGTISGPLGVPPEEGHNVEPVKSPRLPEAENAINGLQSLPAGVGAASGPWSNVAQMNRVLAATGFQENFEVEVEGEVHEVSVRGLDFEVGNRVQELLRDLPDDFFSFTLQNPTLENPIAEAVRFVIDEEGANPERVVLTVDGRSQIVHEQEEPLPKLGGAKMTTLSPFEQFIAMLIHYVKHGGPPLKPEYDIDFNSHRRRQGDPGS